MYKCGSTEYIIRVNHIDDYVYAVWVLLMPCGEIMLQIYWKIGL